MQTDDLIPSSQIERETGFSKDLLRKWRQRFGFPFLEATGDGPHAYSRATVCRLLLIKRLLKGGFRPAQVVGKDPLELERLRRTLADDVHTPLLTPTIEKLMAQLRKADRAGLQASLAKLRAKGTLAEFVLGTVAPLISAVGDAWARSEIEVYHEHLCTGVVERILNAELLSCKPKRGFPTILFATPPDENHVLGLLMTEAVLADHGADCCHIGPNTPLNDLKLSAEATKADMVALSFSIAYPARNVRPVLAHLRRILPAHIDVWAGGAGVSEFLCVRRE
jgi:methanogenic corrinoid protein MtbC1